MNNKPFDVVLNNRSFYLAWFRRLKEITSLNTIEELEKKYSFFYLREEYNSSIMYSPEGTACNAFIDVFKGEWKEFNGAKKYFFFINRCICPPPIVQNFIDAIINFEYEKDIIKNLLNKYGLINVNQILGTNTSKRFFIYLDLIKYCLRTTVRKFIENKNEIIKSTVFIPKIIDRNLILIES